MEELLLKNKKKYVKRGKRSLIRETQNGYTVRSFGGVVEKTEYKEQFGGFVFEETVRSVQEREYFQYFSHRQRQVRYEGFLETSTEDRVGR